MPLELDPDAALMLRVKQGDAAAFTQLVEKYKQPILNLVWRTVRDETEAEDITQNVFVQAWKSAPRYQATAKFSTWLFTIARNLCLNEFRRRSRHPAESLDQMRDDSDDQPLFQVVDKRIASAQEVLLRGELELKVSAETHVVRVGDSFFFKSDLEHFYRSNTDRPCRVLWINTPPTF